MIGTVGIEITTSCCMRPDLARPWSKFSPSGDVNPRRAVAGWTIGRIPAGAALLTRITVTLVNNRLSRDSSLAMCKNLNYAVFSFNLKVC